MFGNTGMERVPAPPHFREMLILEEQFSRLRGAGFAKLQKRFSKIAALEGARFPKLHLNFP